MDPELRERLRRLGEVISSHVDVLAADEDTFDLFVSGLHKSDIEESVAVVADMTGMPR